MTAQVAVPRVVMKAKLNWHKLDGGVQEAQTTVGITYTLHEKMTVTGPKWSSYVTRPTGRVQIGPPSNELLAIHICEAHLLTVVNDLIVWGFE